MGKQDTGDILELKILRVLVAKRVEESSQLGGLRVHLRLLSIIRHTYCFTKLFHRHGQKLTVKSKLNSISIRIISKTINEIGCESVILSYTACCEACPTCISTKVFELFPHACSFKKIRARKHHRSCRTHLLQELQGTISSL